MNGDTPFVSVETATNFDTLFFSFGTVGLRAASPMCTALDSCQQTVSSS
jgi:hypothetical protein